MAPKNTIIKKVNKFAVEKEKKINMFRDNILKKKLFELVPAGGYWRDLPEEIVDAKSKDCLQKAKELAAKYE